jgi:hypothetical protein
MKYVFISSTSTLIRKYRYVAISFLALGILLFTYSCKPDDPDPSFFEVTTTDAINITLSTAQVDGQVSVQGNPEITTRGVCWSTSVNPTVSDNKTTEGTGAGNFTSTLTGLNENTVYHVRAYATANNEVVYGNEISFTTRTIEIYISGYEGSRAVYWRNGQKVQLTDGTYNAGASSIFVADNDIYVAGYEYGNNSQSAAKYWKNGQAIMLALATTLGSTSSSLFVLENNVYVAGREFYSATNKFQAKYWKNGEGTSLTDGSDRAEATSIFVLGNDIYVAGFEYNSNGPPVAKYWKNGGAVSLSTTYSKAQSIFVSGSDIYVAGYEKLSGILNGDRAKYWKNGSPVSLGNSSSYATSIFVSGSDVYVAGYEDNGSGYVAKYWKNGEAVSLTNGDYATSIFVFGNDVYVAGSQETYTSSNNSYINAAKYWKNGVAVPLNTDGSDSGATGIFVRLK